MNNISILMLEDNPIDARVIQKTLTGSSNHYNFTVTASGEDYLRKLRNDDFDLILCDFQLPGSYDGIKALKARNEVDSTIPFILVTGAVPEDIAIALVQEGADDYILKTHLKRLPVAVEKTLRKRRIQADKMKLETSLFDLTQRFQLAAKASSDIIWDYDIEKDTIYCSEAIERVIGIKCDAHFDPAFLSKFIHPDDLASVKRSLLETLQGKEHRWRKIFRVLKADATVGWVNSNAMLIRNREDIAVRIVGVMQDVTEIRRLQHELVEKELMSQKQITELTIQAQEKERMEIGKELHDNVNQLLATAKIMIDTARTAPELHDLCLSKSQESIMEAIAHLRNLAHSMMPPPFERNAFEEIITDLVFKINLTGKANVQISLPPRERLAMMNNRIKLTFYRIIQEQLSNILKYAKAKNVSIRMEVNDNAYLLVLEDDGVGFDLLEKSDGIGLRNIESRITMLNGTLDIFTKPGEGCVLQASIPVVNKEEISSLDPQD